MLCSPIYCAGQADELYSRFLLPGKVSRHSMVQSRDVLIPIDLKDKLFLVLDDPQCCGLAKVVSLSMMAVIVLSCVIYVISTDPSLRYKCELWSSSSCITLYLPSCLSDIICVPDMCRLRANILCAKTTQISAPTR